MLKLNEVLDNNGYPPTTSVGNNTSISNTIKYRFMLSVFNSPTLLFRSTQQRL